MPARSSVGAMVLRISAGATHSCAVRNGAATCWGYDGYAALGNGIGRYALDKAADYARNRHVWGTPIGSHQGVSHPLAHAKIQVELARLMTQRAASLHDAGDPGSGEASNMAKYAAAEAGILALDQAIQTHGGNGMATEYGLATLWGPARLMRTAPISREMILNFVAQHSLKLPASY